MCPSLKEKKISFFWRLFLFLTDVVHSYNGSDPWETITIAHICNNLLKISLEYTWAGVYGKCVL